MLHDPKFWLAISFLIFISLIIKYVGPLIVKMIDNKSKQIADDLDRAAQIRHEAEILLKNAQKYYDDSVKQSEQLIKDASIESGQLIADCKIAIEDEINKKINVANERIKTEEDRVVRDIKSKIIESAIIAIENNIEKVVDDESLENVAKNSISQISSKLMN
jgi:F-type H+-transporting ATPase subunit b